MKCSGKSRYIGINAVYIEVKLLYKHDKTPQRSLKKRFLAPSPNDSRERSVRKVQQDNMTLWINTTFLKVLREVLTGLLIMEPNMKRVPGWSSFGLGCHVQAM